MTRRELAWTGAIAVGAIALAAVAFSPDGPPSRKMGPIGCTVRTPKEAFVFYRLRCAELRESYVRDAETGAVSPTCEIGDDTVLVGTDCAAFYADPTVRKWIDDQQEGAR